MNILKSFLIDIKKLELEHLICFSKELYELLFNIRIAQLLKEHPPEDSNGVNNFWVGYKMMPTPAELNLEDSSKYNALKFIT